MTHTFLPIRKYVRLAGVLFLLSLFAGAFGEMYVPGKILVAGNAAATANNIRELNSLFRLGFAAYLVEAICDVILSLMLYQLLRPVRRDLALLAAFFGLISTALFAVAELFYFSSSLILGKGEYLKSFPPDQLNALAMLSLRLYGIGGGIFMVFYGLATMIRGYLMVRSGYFPKFLGVLLLFAGFGFVANNVTLVLMPSLSSGLFLLPMFIALLALIFWFLVKGIDEEKWRESVAGF